MRGLTLIFLLFLVAGCNSDDLSWISIQNNTTIPIYVQPYSADFANSNWIQPGVADEFYSLQSDCLDGFDYFSFYYDSLIVHLKDMDENPVKFYKDGTTINYDPTLNPFINEEVWKLRNFEKHLDGSAFNTLEEKHIFEYYFCISTESVKSLSDTITQELQPAF